jgi:hypothetical protein
MRFGSIRSQPLAVRTETTFGDRQRPSFCQHAVNSLSCGSLSRAFKIIWQHSLVHYVEPAIGYAKSYSRSHGAVIHVYDDAGNMIQTHEHEGEFKEPQPTCCGGFRFLKAE